MWFFQKVQWNGNSEIILCAKNRNPRMPVASRISGQYHWLHITQSIHSHTLNIPEISQNCNTNFLNSFIHLFSLCLKLKKNRVFPSAGSFAKCLLNSQGWTWFNVGAQNFLWVSQKDWTYSGAWAIIHCFPECTIAGIQMQAKKLWLEPDNLMWDTGLPRGSSATDLDTCSL